MIMIPIAEHRPVQCAKQFPELKICLALQFRTMDPPNPARRFVEQNENLRLAQRRAMKNLENIRFATAACAKMYEICLSLQFRAMDPPNPARGFVQQNENLRLATPAYNQKPGNGRFATAACAKNI